MKHRRISKYVVPFSAIKISKGKINEKFVLGFKFQFEIYFVKDRENLI